MGEFTSRARYMNEQSFQYRRSSTSDILTGSSCLDADYVYSWRTRKTLADMSDRDAGTFSGIKMPRKSGSLAERIADRKRFAEDIDRQNGSPIDNRTPFHQIKYYPSVDTGHPFTSVKFRTLRTGAVKRVHRETGNTVYSGPVIPQQYASRPTGVPSIAAFTTLPLPVVGASPTTLERNNKLGPTFHGMLPQKEYAKISETIISLVRGEFPSILKNLQHYRNNWVTLQDSWKKLPGYAGGEYINSVFAWQPIIRDFEAAIKVLLFVDGLVYGSAVRRHRVIPWDVKTWSDTSSPQLYSQYELKLPDGSPSVSYSGIPMVREHTMSYDMRLSARLVPIARPGIGANHFVSGALDKLEQLGLFYPALGWDILPYSWLIDWVTNIGSAITNATRYGSKPGQTNIDYAYATACMRHGVTHYFARQGTFPTGLYDTSVFGTGRQLTIYKDRQRATPFGFGLDLSGLSPSQIAILVALGLTKIR